MLEDAMGLAAWVGGFAVVTVAVTVHFRQMVPLGQVCTLGSWVSRVDAQEVHVRGLLAGPAGQAFADADGSYLIIQDQVRQC